MKAAIRLLGGIAAVGAAAILTLLLVGPRAAYGPNSLDYMKVSDAPAEEALFAEVDWVYWLGKSNRVVGWVSVPDTKISSPIVLPETNDPAYYLDHDISGNDDEAGCPFLDAECAHEGLLSKNSAIFGHNLSNGDGFADFARFLDEDYADRHKSILVQTPSWKRVLKVIGVECTEGSAPTKVINFEDDDQFKVWLGQRYDACCVKLEPVRREAISTERVWTFCTCSYTRYANERTLVYAVEA